MDQSYQKKNTQQNTKRVGKHGKALERETIQVKNYHAKVQRHHYKILENNRKMNLPIASRIPSPSIITLHSNARGIKMSIISLITV